MKDMLFIVNPKAGRTTLKNTMSDVIEIFCRADYRVRVYMTQAAGDATRIVEQEGPDYDVIVCAGGDGTLGNTMTGLLQLEKRIPLGYIPCGTTNDYARSMEIPRQGLDAATTIVNAAKPFAVDMADLNGNYFVYVAAFGAFTDTSYATPQNIKNIFGHAAYVLQGIKSVVNIPTYKLRITFDGSVTYEGEYIYGMISNSVSVGGYKSITSNGVEFDDGLFEVVLIRKISEVEDLQRIATSLLMGQTNDENMVAYSASKIEIESETPIAWTLDGEFGGEILNSTITVHKQVVDLLI